MSLSYSAPLYLLFDVVVPAFHDDEFESAEKNVEDDGSAAPRACASDLSALADELFRGAGVLLPLKLPPRLQHPADFSSSAATSPTSAAHLLGRVPSSSSSSSSWSPFASSRRQHRGFDPFAAALEKVRRDDGGEPAAPSRRRRRARSLSPVRGADERPATTCLSCSRSRRAGATTAATQQKANGRPRRRRDSAAGAPYRRPSLLVCFGF